MAVEKAYELEAPQGKVSLLDLNSDFPKHHLQVKNYR